jgi:hypothetical protein
MQTFSFPRSGVGTQLLDALASQARAKDATGVGSSATPERRGIAFPRRSVGTSEAINDFQNGTRSASQRKRMKGLAAVNARSTLSIKFFCTASFSLKSPTAMKSVRLRSSMQA